MTCKRAERMLAAAGDVPLSERESAELRLHAGSCETCAALLSTLDALRDSAAAFDVPDPGPSYWIRFEEGIETRLAAATRAAPAADRARFGFGYARWFRGRLALVVGALAILAIGIVVLAEWGDRFEAPRAANEEDLLARLGEASPEEVDRALDLVAPLDPLSAHEDLAATVSTFGDDQGPNGGSDSLYELFLDLDDEDRGFLLEEMRAEIG